MTTVGFKGLIISFKRWDFY